MCDLLVQGLGLSPRVRGNQLKHGKGTLILGTIPACAGEPTQDTVPHSLKKDYPRVCGGTAPGKCLEGTEWGLSPRVRGNLWKGREFQLLLGTIPACAGEPSPL